MNTRNKNILTGILVGVLGSIVVVFRKPIANFIKQLIKGGSIADKKTKE